MGTAEPRPEGRRRARSRARSFDPRRRWTGSRPLRRALRRRALSWVLAIGVAATMGTVLSGARAERAAWGLTVDVVVASRDLQAGDPVDHASARIERRPRAHVPDGALDALPVGRRAAAPVPAGEVVISSRLAGANRGARSASLGSGRGLVALPRHAALPGPPVGVGDLVNLYSPDPAGVTASNAVARRAEVRAVDEEVVTVEVDLVEATAVADALTSGRLVLVVVG